MRFFKKSKRRQDRVKKRNSSPKLVLIRQIVLGVFLLVLVVMIGVGVWYGSRVDRLSIDTVEVIGGTTVSHQSIEDIARQQLVGEYYHLVPRTFAWTYPEAAIEREVAAIERIKHVQLERTGKKITIIFDEYTPFALWCETLDSQECLFLDHNGFAFGSAPKLQGGAFLRFGIVGEVPQLQQTPFNTEFIQATTDFIKTVYDELGLNIIQVERVADDELLYHISGGGMLKVSQRLSYEETLDNLVTLLTSEAFSHIEPGKFQYIDLRYGNKVFVNEEEPTTTDVEVASSTATSTS